MPHWLNEALDAGITEADFWDMTIAELNRAMASAARRARAEAQEKASFDYALADLIGRSIARIYSSSARMPEISEMYPTLFDSEEVKEQKARRRAELSALRFRQFAQTHNEHFEEANGINE